MPFNSVFCESCHVADTLTRQHLLFFHHNLLHMSIQLFYKAINSTRPKNTICSYPGYKSFLQVLRIKFTLCQIRFKTENITLRR